MIKKYENLYEFPANLLFCIGLIDLLRGVLHTFFIEWAVATFAKLDLSNSRSDQLTLLCAFGISNLLTGLIYLLISKKAKELSPYVLGIIPVAYFIGYIGLKFSGITAQSALLGRYFMLIYLFVCIVTFGIFLYKKNSIDSRKK